METANCSVCGGLISSEILLDGEYACQCSGRSVLVDSKQANQLNAESTQSLTLTLPAEPVGDVAELQAEVPKVCVRCGLDLVGKRRMRNNQGYWCPPCAEADSLEKSRVFMSAAAEVTGSCEECGRIAKADELLHVDGKVFCSICAEGRPGKPFPYAAPADVNSQTQLLGKRCCSCGADVSKARRLRDKRGYWCEPCHLADAESKQKEKEQKSSLKNRPKELRCLECGEMAPTAELTTVKGVEICPKCVEEGKRREQKEKEDARRNAANRSRYQQEDEELTARRKRRNILVTLAVVVLVFLSLWQNGVILKPGH